MSELAVGSIAGLASNSFEVSVASGSTLDLSTGAKLPAGSILQVVSATKTNTFSQTTTTFTDIPDLSVTITPSSSTSKVLIFYQVNVNSRSTLVGSSLRLMRGATPICIGDAASSRPRVSNGLIISLAESVVSNSNIFLDSPSTTSATTYKLQLAGDNNTNAHYVNRSHSDTDSLAGPRSASTITVMEVAG